MTSELQKIKYVFYGTGPLAESALYHLYLEALVPTLVITTPDKEIGRGHKIQKNIIVDWCESKNIQVWQPASFKNLDISNTVLGQDFDLGLVASFPKILSENILNLPKYKTLNIHPSLLPKYRGPSPIQTSLLNGDLETGVSIIKLDAEVDHGPILIQKSLSISNLDTNQTLEKRCGEIGAELISQILDSYIAGVLKLIPQEHYLASFTHKFTKADGQINLQDDAQIVQNKFRALLPHIPVFFTVNKNEKTIRVKVTEIDLNSDHTKSKSAQDIIEKVIPEGKPEMNFEDFTRGYLN